jgi:uncharacterized membrane protein
MMWLERFGARIVAAMVVLVIIAILKWALNY